MKKMRLVAGAAVLGIGAGSASMALTHSSSGAAPVTPPAVTAFTTNASGQTIGGIARGGAVPDLIAIDVTESGVQMLPGAVASAGIAGPTTGYIYSKDLYAPAATNPAEAAQQTQQSLDANGDVWVLVYARDGQTVIGKFRSAHVSFGDAG